MKNETFTVGPVHGRLSEAQWIARLRQRQINPAAHDAWEEVIQAIEHAKRLADRAHAAEEVLVAD